VSIDVLCAKYNEFGMLLYMQHDFTLAEEEQAMVFIASDIKKEYKEN